MINNKYIYLIVPFAAIITAQVIKFIIESIRTRKIRWGRLFNGCGGMPSTHTAFTFSLVSLIGFKDGMTSSSFAIALVFALIVAYDAMGLRMESGNQAVAINRILNEIYAIQATYKGKEPWLLPEPKSPKTIEKTNSYINQKQACSKHCRCYSFNFQICISHFYKLHYFISFV